MTEPAAIVTDFLAELSQPRPRVDELVSYFTTDAVWWDAPVVDPPSTVFAREARGTDELRAKFEGLGQVLDEIRGVDIRNLVAEGEPVLSERVDRVVVRGQAVDIEICAVFKIRDGKISLWRDYYSL